MTPTAWLERDPLRNIVLLKHLEAYQGRTRTLFIEDGDQAGALIHLAAAEAPYDREMYPEARIVALISSDSAAITARLLDRFGETRGVVFKLASDADRATLAARLPTTERACFLSFTGDAGFTRQPGIEVTTTPDDAAYALFAIQHHERAWLAPLLASGDAFACVRDGAACFAFRNHGDVWEVGGVVTRPDLRGRGLARDVVRTCIAVLAERTLRPRYQVSATNAPSIRVAEAIGLRLFLRVTHHTASEA